MERTLSIIKPDGVARGLMGEVIKRLEDSDRFSQVTIAVIDRADLGQLTFMLILEREEVE